MFSVHCTTSVAALLRNLESGLAAEQADRARLIIFADMGWDPDEEQQMIHMLMCSNEFELEGLIAVTGRFLRKNPPPYGRDLDLEYAGRSTISLTIPQDAAGRELHLILEVWDDSDIVPLVDYRRGVISVN